MRTESGFRSIATPGADARARDAGPHVNAPILIVDDLDAHRELNEAALRRFGYRNLSHAASGEDALVHLAAHDAHLVVLDLGLPRADGYEVLARIDATVQGPHAPNVLVVTAESSPEARQRALKAGANEVLVKPIHFPTLGRQVRLLLDLREVLHRFADERTRSGRAPIEALRSELARRIADAGRPHGYGASPVARLGLAREEARGPRLDASDAAAEARMRRVGTLAALVALRLDVPDEEARRLQDAACLYDVGIATFPAGMLAAEGALSDEERALVRDHALIGEAILAATDDPLFTLAAQVARHHHERWDGSGYPDGLVGGDIPLPGRIYAACDVFDARTHGRPHRPPLTVAQALYELRSQAGRQFDPKVVEALVATVEAFPELTAG